MNILVNDVAASTSGALTVLNQFYKQYATDKDNQYLLCLGIPDLSNTDNITVLRFPWVKRTWLHRIFFDFVYVKKLIRKYNIDEIISLQNTMVASGKVPQTVYLHQAIPFTQYKFHLRDNLLLWIYQNILAKFIFYSLKHCNVIIVQVNWIKKEIVRRLGIPEEKVKVIAPDLDVSQVKTFIDINSSYHSFFYPATPFEYKNHQLIIDACKLICDTGMRNFKVLFTLSGEENDYSKNIKREINKLKLPICLVGRLSKEQVLEWYQHSVLLFPSFVESHPMPLKEARLTKTPILASYLPSSLELLEGYEKMAYFDPYDAQDLARKMVALMEKREK